jgi:hypothetical protein
MSDLMRKQIEHQAGQNTDRELWREREGDYYADSIHVTKGGGIGIDCGGSVIVMPLRKWHDMALRAEAAERKLAEAVAAEREECAKVCENDVMACTNFEPEIRACEECAAAIRARAK